MSAPVRRRILTPVPIFERLVAGSRLHRIHSARRKGGEFNDSNKETRFAPLAADEGRRIPVLYAGRTFDVAVHEALFRGSRTWPLSKLESVAHSVLLTGRPLNLVLLNPINLQSWGIEDNIVSVPGREYYRTRRLGEDVHRSFAEADGMAWISNREGRNQCYLFYGDRVTTRDFIVERRRDARDDEFRADLFQSASDSDITVTI